MAANSFSVQRKTLQHYHSTSSQAFQTLLDALKGAFNYIA